MADQPSRDAKVAVSVAGAVYTDVGGTREAIDFDVSGEVIDTTDRDSGVHKSNIPGRGASKLSFSGNYDEADAGHEILRTASLAHTQLYFRYRPKTGAGSHQNIALGTITSYKVSSPNDGINQFSCSVDLSGDPTAANQ